MTNRVTVRYKILEVENFGEFGELGELLQNRQKFLVQNFIFRKIQVARLIRKYAVHVCANAWMSFLS